MKTLKKILRVLFMIIGVYLLMYVMKQWAWIDAPLRFFTVGTGVLCFYYALDAL